MLRALASDQLRDVRNDCCFKRVPRKYISTPPEQEARSPTNQPLKMLSLTLTADLTGSVVLSKVYVIC